MTTRVLPLDWHLAEHVASPRITDAPGDCAADGVESFCYAGPSHRGAPSRSFAYLGLPPEASSDAPVPGMVLVHGGTGTAFAEWVRLWMARGYAAIAMDTCGCVPVRTGPSPEGEEGWRRLPEGGPPGWGGFDQTDEAIHDRWMYHAVANILRAHSLLAARPEVDARCIVLIGISWGAILTGVCAGLDARLAGTVLVYGCGYLNRSPLIGEHLRAMPPDHAARWSHLWDPATYLPGVTCPTLWINGTNDRHFIPPLWQRSTELPVGPVTRSLQVGLGHGHLEGWAPTEIGAWVDALAAGGDPLPRIVEGAVEGDRITARVLDATAEIRAELVSTNDDGPWAERRWTRSFAKLAGNRLEAGIPPDVTACHLQVIDPRGLLVSGPEHITIP